jgi:hypothetical protein
MTVVASIRSAERWASSRAPTARSAAANAGTWTDWSADESATVARLGPADPTIPGSAARARAAVSAAPATNLLGRTIEAR